MNYKPLGKTDIRVSAIGFGTWGIGGITRGKTSYGPTNKRESLSALRYAFDQGINFYDTSNIYGNGKSEELLGITFAHRRGQVIIATKVGFIPNSEKRDFSIKNILGSLRDSLKRLKTDYVDIYQLHNPPIEILRKNPKIISTLSQLKEAGIIRAYGISVQTPEDGLKAIKEFDFPIIQVNFNMIDQRADDIGLLDLAYKNNIGIISRTPLGYGFLSDKINPAKFHPKDHRTRWSEKQIERWMSAPKLFSVLNKNNSRTLSQLALQFAISHPAISTTIPGMLKPEEVKENSKAVMHKPLSLKEITLIRSIYTTNTFFVK